MKPKPIVVIIPTYYELDNIPALTQQLLNLPEEVHVLYVNDSPGDGTAAWIEKHEDYQKRVFIIERKAKLGLSSAYKEGFSWALQKNYELIAQMDADFSHDPADLSKFFKAIDDGADLVLGSRYLGGVRVLNWPISRLLLSLGAGEYVRAITGMPYTDPTGGFKCFKRNALAKIELGEIHSTGYAFQIEMTHYLWRMSCKIVEIPIIFADRHFGSSKMSGGIVKEAIWQVLRLGFKGRRFSKL
jgi:dolichol-phosphate mannosyltransferase